MSTHAPSSALSPARRAQLSLQEAVNGLQRATRHMDMIADLGHRTGLVSDARMKELATSARRCQAMVRSLAAWERTIADQANAMGVKT